MLNSIIFEGVVSVSVSDDGVFSVNSERYEKVGEEKVVTTITVLCKAQGNLLESAEPFLKEGRGLRIVGRLWYINNMTGVLAEHIEFIAGSKVRKVGKYNFIQD